MSKRSTKRKSTRSSSKTSTKTSTKSSTKRTKKRTTYGSSKAKQNVWNKAKTIRGRDPKVYRQDPYGQTMYYSSYGKYTPMGWHMDHIKPQSKGGSHDIINLQAMTSKMNNKKSNSLVKRSRHTK